MKAPSSKRYEGKHLDQVAFPLGGTGAGMFCLEGTGALPLLLPALGIKRMYRAGH